jgi:hypothetical protein
MKIEIDLNDIFHDDDYGSETLQESVRRQVVDRIARDFREKIAIKVDDAVSKAVSDTVSLALKETSPRLVADLLDAEYTPVDKYGHKGEKTTFRSQVLLGIQKDLVYRKENYQSDTNYFTRTIDAVVKEKVDEFRKSFVDKVNASYISETMEFAVKTLKDRLGIK